MHSSLSDGCSSKPTPRWVVPTAQNPIYCLYFFMIFLIQSFLLNQLMENHYY